MDALEWLAAKVEGQFVIGKDAVEVDHPRFGALQITLGNTELELTIERLEQENTWLSSEVNHLEQYIRELENRYESE